MAITQAIRTPPRRHKSGCPTSGRLGRGAPPSRESSGMYTLAAPASAFACSFVCHPVGICCCRCLSSLTQTSSFRPEQLAHLRVAAEKSASLPMSSLFPRSVTLPPSEKGHGNQNTKPEGYRPMPLASNLKLRERAAEDWWFDTTRSVQTSGVLPRSNPSDVVGELKDGRQYGPVRAANARTALRELPIKNYSAYTFIDIGSGKGRVLFEIGRASCRERV